MGSQPKKTKEIQSINQSINQLILFKDGTLSNTASAFALPRGCLENFRIKF